MRNVRAEFRCASNPGRPRIRRPDNIDRAKTNAWSSRTLPGQSGARSTLRGRPIAKQVEFPWQPFRWQTKRASGWRKRAIGRRRRVLRCVLYQAALVASYHNTDLDIFAKRLRDKGKPINNPRGPEEPQALRGPRNRLPGDHGARERPAPDPHDQGIQRRVSSRRAGGDTAGLTEAAPSAAGIADGPKRGSPQPRSRRRGTVEVRPRGRGVSRQMGRTGCYQPLDTGGHGPLSRRWFRADIKARRKAAIPWRRSVDGYVGPSSGRGQEARARTWVSSPSPCWLT